ncbi:MAG: right-handed parallel beta-helix repeat-containing protein [Ignavibacteria bacterium]
MIFSILLFTVSSYSQIYVAPGGSDGNPGTFMEPLATIPAAVIKAQPGDTIYLRGGTYTLSTTITISRDGSESSRFYLSAFNYERPLLNFSSMAVSSSNRGIRLSGDYWHVKGINIKGAGDNGMNVSGSNNIIEFCSFFENRDTGLQLSGGASNNQIINCDSYFNADPDNGDADGFAPKLDVGSGNYFYGCRAWQNSDDGWDGYLRPSNDINTTLENCWCFANGYLKNGNPSSGNGNGYKMGGSDDRTLMHNFTLKNCIAFDNRVKGFDQNNNKGSMIIYNSSAYRNGTNYSITSPLNAGKTAEIINGLSLGAFGSLGAFVAQQTNSWQSSFNVAADDFISIDTSGVRGPRNADGSLPDINFLHLAPGSDLINGGTDVGLPFAGSAPDLGAFETGLNVPVELTAFSASVSGELIVLNWTTATELNNYGFEIQKKFVNEFTTVGFVKGSGSSVEQHQYHFIDKNIAPGFNSYRLRQIDFNGSSSYSNEIRINFNGPYKFNLSQNYPNPFNPVTLISFSLAENEPVSLLIYNMLGEKAAVLIDNEMKEPGYYKLNFNAENLSSGTYFYVLRQGEKMLSKKMILIK